MWQRAGKRMWQAVGLTPAMPPCTGLQRLAGGYGGYHQVWANGYWHGYHDSPNWNWGSFALGSNRLHSLGLGSPLYSWGYDSYGNPYFSTETMAQPIVIEQTVVAGEPQTVTFPAVSYDYSQPIDTQSPPPPAVADPAVAKFDEGRAAFKAGDYVKALQITDEAIKSLPNDATLHEFRRGPVRVRSTNRPRYRSTPCSRSGRAGLDNRLDFIPASMSTRNSSGARGIKGEPQVGRPFVLAYHYLPGPQRRGGRPVPAGSDVYLGLHPVGATDQATLRQPRHRLCPRRAP